MLSRGISALKQADKACKRAAEIEFEKFSDSKKFKVFFISLQLLQVALK